MKILCYYGYGRASIGAGGCYVDKSPVEVSSHEEAMAHCLSHMVGIIGVAPEHPKLEKLPTGYRLRVDHTEVSFTYQVTAPGG